jgi:hypothetical protein
MPWKRAGVALRASLPLVTLVAGMGFGRSAWAGFACAHAGLSEHGASAGGAACANASHLLFLGVVALVAIVALRMRHATARRRLDLARRMVEQGMSPPAELIRPHGNDLRRGLVLVATGAGLLAYTAIGHGSTMVGLVPAFIGAGYMLSHRFASGS